MTNENDQAFAKKLAQIEANPDLTILASMNHQNDDKIKQYIVYTDFKEDGQQQKINSIFVYTPFANVDKFGHSKVDFQAQLLFETNKWKKQMHITVIETLGAESRLAFYDFQNLGLAQLAMKAFLSLGRRVDVQLIDGNISSFDHDSFAKITHILEKNDFEIKMSDADHAGTFMRKG